MLSAMAEASPTPLWGLSGACRLRQFLRPGSVNRATPIYRYPLRGSARSDRSRNIQSAAADVEIRRRLPNTTDFREKFACLHVPWRAASSRSKINAKQPSAPGG